MEEIIKFTISGLVFVAGMTMLYHNLLDSSHHIDTWNVLGAGVGILAIFISFMIVGLI